MKLAGRVALVTGAARVGQAVIAALAARGCSVMLTYRTSRERMERAAAAARALGVRAELAKADLRRERDLESVAAAVERKFGRLDVLVHMASPYASVAPEDLEKRRGGRMLVAEAWSDSMDSEARAAFLLSLRLAALMRRGGGGRVVLLSDWLPTSERPRYKEHPAYYVAKAAVKASCEFLALALAPDILVNAIAPGPIQGPDDMSAADQREAARNTPLKRWGGADEIAKAALFLIDTDFMTGETVRIDGGRHLY